jgi:hypothetical protein
MWPNKDAYNLPCPVISLFASNSTLSASLYLGTNFVEIFAADEYQVDSIHGTIRLSCLMEATQLNTNSGTYVYIYINDGGRIPSGGYHHRLYNLVSGITPPSTVMCRDVQITNDFRYFIYLETYDSFSAIDIF